VETHWVHARARCSSWGVWIVPHTRSKHRGSSTSVVAGTSCSYGACPHSQSVQDVDEVIMRRVPVELLHAPIPDQRGKLEAAVCSRCKMVRARCQRRPFSMLHRVVGSMGCTLCSLVRPNNTHHVREVVAGDHDGAEGVDQR